MLRYCEQDTNPLSGRRKVCFRLKIIDGTFQMEITYNYVDSSLKLKGVLSTKKYELWRLHNL